MRSNNDNSVVLVLYLAMLLICAVSTVSSVAGMTLDMKDAEANYLKTAKEENMLPVNIDAYADWYRHALVSQEDYRDFNKGKDVNVIIHCYDREYIVKSTEIKSIDLLCKKNVSTSNAELLEDVLSSSKLN